MGVGVGKGRRRRAGAGTSRAPRPLRRADLLDGVPGPGRTTLRLGRPEDRPDLARLLALTGEQPEEQVFASIGAGAAATLVLGGLETDRDGLLQQIGPMLATGDGLYDVAVGLMSVLVAEDAAGAKVGVLLAHPPTRVLQQIGAAGVPLPQLIVTALAVVKIKGLAVDERVRGQGVGSALLRHCTRMYLQLGYYLIYGQLVTGRGLESYYANRGFTVLDKYERLSLDVIVGFPVSFGPDDAQERLFARWR
jgi:ribosomal protein S18 acetylase RimI-like enzyme